MTTDDIIRIIDYRIADYSRQFTGEAAVAVQILRELKTEIFEEFTKEFWGE